MHGPAARLSVNRANREAAGLQPGLPLAEGLLRFGRDILADAREAFDDPQKSGSAAVHDFRKAMKRWRAFLRVLQPAFGAEVRRPRIAARDLARRLSAARDAQSALDALADLTKAEAPPPARSLATITARLQALRTGVETSTLTDAARAEVAAALASAETTLDQLALQDVTFAHFADGLGASYARARAAVPENWLTADTDALHELRTRVVVHRYQMDLVEPLWPRLGRLWVAEAQRLRDRLGTCQDLAVLAKLTEPRQPLAPWRSRLAPAIAARQAAHVDAAARLVGRLFAEKPKAFRRRIAALWKHRDHADA